MSLRDHEPISFNQFRGTFDRGEDESVPPGFFKGSRNIQFINQGIKTRDGSAIDTAETGPIRRIAIYKRIGEVARLLILNNAGVLFDSITHTAILTIPAMSDFSMVSMFNRAYITPHNGLRGLPGEKLYVYEGSGVARPAGGTAPPPTGMQAAEGVAGNFDPGIHLFAVAFETASGYITPFGSSCAISSTTGGKKVDLSAIPTGPLGTVARVLMGTKDVAINGVFSGDFNNQTWYVIPDGRIPDNSTTVKTVSYFDADLQSDISYLSEQMGSIPAGVGVNIYRGRLIIWGEDVNESIVRASAIGQPESFDEADGFVTINPGDSGGGVRFCFEYRTQLICCKSQRSYITQDNGDNAGSWKVDALDKSVGTECHGVGKILDFGEDVRDRAFIADRSGLQLYTGTFSDTEVTSNISDVWDRINKAVFHKVEVAVDPLKGLTYVACPLDVATENNAIIVVDWSEGLTVEDIRFTIWEFPYRPQTVVVDVNEADKESVMKFAGLDSINVFKIVENLKLDNNLAIDTWVEFPLLPQDDDWPVNHFTGFRARIKGVGYLLINLTSLDDAQQVVVPPVTLNPQPGRPLFRGFNFTSERCSVKLRTNQSGNYFMMTNFNLYYKLLWSTRAE
jgi:hypothetical protein